MNLTFEGVEEVPDKFNPENAPWLVLKTARPDGKKGNFTAAMGKYSRIMKDFDKVKEYADKPGDILILPWERNGSPVTIELVCSVCQAIVHYEPEITAYRKKYARPVELIAEPMEILVEDRQNFMNPPSRCIQLPCWPREDNDTGEGQRPWTISTWTTKLLLRESQFKGKLHEEFASFMKKNPGAVFTLNYENKDKIVKSMKFDEFQMKAYLTHKSRVNEFYIEHVAE